MATVSSLADNSLPGINTGLQHVQKVLSISSTEADNGDDISVFTFPPQFKGFLHRASLRVSATLGAGATLTLRVGTTAVTGASTAGAASKVDSDSDTDVPLEVNGGDRVNLLVGGADIAAAADATVDLIFSARE